MNLLTPINILLVIVCTFFAVDAFQHSDWFWVMLFGTISIVNLVFAFIPYSDE